MTNQEIQDKYGIYPIMKEMWVWNDDKDDMTFELVKYKEIHNMFYKFICINSEGINDRFKNASETNPNEREPKVGDKGYFWDNETAYLYATLINIEQSTPKFDTDGYGIFTNFSHEKRPWMK